MLKLRVVTAAILAAVSLWAIYGWSPLWFSLFLLAAVACCGWEWSSLLNLERTGPRFIYTVFVTISAGILMYLNNGALLSVMVLVAILCWIATVIDLVIRPVIPKIQSIRWGLLTLATFLLITPVLSFVWMRENHSATSIVYIVAVVAAADIGAYFTGRKFGRRKLAENISGGKTIEGAVGGLVSALMVALIVLTLVPLADAPTPSLLFFSLTAALFSIAGDLFISRAKRARGVKDSGSLLPGHGGVLDRFDGLLAAVPWVAFAMLWT